MPSPISAYGQSKAAGEAAVLAAHPAAAVVRTSWVFSRHEGFARKMLQRAREETTVRMVADQMSCPTSARALARALIVVAEPRPPRGGARVRLAGDHPPRLGAGDRRRRGARRPLPWVTIEPIEAAAFPSPARRPAQTVLGTSRARGLGLPLASWLDELSPVRLPA
jgi:dTDP-4-dehydrorhamnose reductase